MPGKYLTKSYGKDKIKYLLCGVILFYFIIAVLTLVHSPMNLSWDPALCLKMTDNGYKHIPFNEYAHPAPQNLNRDQYEFVTWWSPAQFTLPLLIEKFFGLKLVNALKLLNGFCMVISALGIFNLFKFLLKKDDRAFDNTGSVTLPSLLLLMFTITQPFFWANTSVYDGGGILMLTYCPWFICGVIGIKRINIYNAVLLLIAAFVGFFLKTAFSSIFIGALLYLFISVGFSAQKRILQQGYNKIALIGSYCIGILIIYIIVAKAIFLSHNTNISNSSQGIRLQARVFFFSVSAPLLNMFSLDILNRTYQWTASSLIIVPFYYLVFTSKSLSLLHRKIILSFVITCTAFYSLLYFWNVDVSYGLRHYQVITILLTPALAFGFQQQRYVNYTLQIIMALYFCFNICRYIGNLRQSYQTPKRYDTLSGLPTQYPVELIKELHNLDNANDNGKDIFYFQSSEPSIALEIRNNRVLLEDNFVNFHFDNKSRFDSVVYFGHNNGQLYVVYPLSSFKEDSTKYLTRFERYKKFDKIYQAKGYAIFKGKALN